MDISSILMWMIMFCVVVILLMVFSKPLKWVLRVIISACLGFAGIVVLNIFLTPLNIAVGVNALTLLVAGVLGAPGVISLYALQMML